MNRYYLSDQSIEHLSTCDDRLINIIQHAIKVSPYDFKVIEGHRSLERQLRLYQQGASKIDGITRKGKHNYFPSRAVDVAPYPIDWQDTSRFYTLAGTILTVASMFNVNLRWGGDWDGDGSFRDQTFHDLPHFELRD